MTSRSGITEVQYPLSPDDLRTLRNRDRRQGADLLPMRPRDDRAAHQAARGRLVVRASAALAAADRRDRDPHRPGDPRRLGAWDIRDRLAALLHALGNRL